MGKNRLAALVLRQVLNQNTKNIAVCINCPPKPELLSADHDDDLIDVRFVIWLSSALADTVVQMAAEAINPYANGLPAAKHTTLSIKIFHIARA